MRKLDEEVRNIREMLTKKKKGNAEVMDKSKMAKVSWEKGGVNGDYSAERLRELFMEFGEVEDVVIRRIKRSALVVMASKEALVAATRVLIGDLLNPLLVLPLQPMPSVRAQELPIDNVVGAGYQTSEKSVLEKLKKAAQKQK